MSDLDGSAVASLRRLNGSKVLSVLRTEAYRKFTVREMSIATGLSRPTVGRLLEDLVEAGWALDVEGQPGSTGRPARRYWFNRLRGLILSIDVGLAGAAVMATDLVGGELHWSYQLEQVLATTDAAIDFVMPMVDRALQDVQSVRDGHELPVLAVSISAPVFPDSDGTALDALAIVSGWTGGNLATPFRQRFGDIPVLVNNDLALSAEAEVNLGALADAQQGLYLYFAYFSAAALTHRGKVHEGVHHLAGDIGSLDEYRWPDAVQETLESVGSPKGRMQPVVDKAVAGDTAAREGLAGLARRLSKGAADLTALWDPDIVVFDGQLSRAGAVFLDPIRDALAELGHNDFELRESEVPADKGSCLGGVIRAIEAIDWTVY